MTFEQNSGTINHSFTLLKQATFKMNGVASIEQSGTKRSFPKTVIIVGAGVFGLSTALAIANRYPSTNVTVVDRLTPPVPDGTSVDTTRCIRSGKKFLQHLSKAGGVDV